MAIRDVLLALSSYPQCTPAAAVAYAAEFAAALGARLSAVTHQIEIISPGAGLAGALLDIPGMVAAERHKSAANAKELMGLFETVAAGRGLPREAFVETCPTSQVAGLVAERAMMHDLTMIPIGEHAPFHQYVAESAVFGSGRPVIVFPEAPTNARTFSLDTVAVAWDFSRPAARAVADALPILARAGTVRVVTVTREKPIAARRTVADLARHLAAHGITAVVEEEDVAGRQIGQALADYTRARQADLLVMGAYAHSRMRDFVLGGATRTIVASPPLPVLLSH